jgi:NAD(P)-dependent dehydrogenase (short-subunit alcohol dehydrogenase family)
MASAAGRTSTILLIGASRGLGHAMADDFLRRGWNVVGTVRSHAPTTPPHALADAHPGRVEIEMLDITRPEQLEALAGRLPGRVFDILFVNAGTTNPDPTQTIGKDYVVSRSHFFMDLSHSVMRIRSH